jgi:hypothetical protein
MWSKYQAGSRKLRSGGFHPRPQYAPVVAAIQLKTQKILHAKTQRRKERGKEDLIFTFAVFLCAFAPLRGKNSFPTGRDLNS